MSRTILLWAKRWHDIMKPSYVLRAYIDKADQKAQTCKHLNTGRNCIKWDHMKSTASLTHSAWCPRLSCLFASSWLLLLLMQSHLPHQGASNGCVTGPFLMSSMAIDWTAASGTTSIPGGQEDILACLLGTPLL